jgi:L-erythro-3,5-diaminohexanoate dehydrogenase
MSRERWGVHRVVRPHGALPQAADVLDAAHERRHPSEMLIDVDTLNVDSASFRQLVVEAERSGRGRSSADIAAHVGERIQAIVRERGKLQNPVTGSGGMLLGTVRSPGDELGARFAVAAGQRIATLVSLTLTPLAITRVRAVHLDNHQVDIDGTAVVFGSGTVALMPADLPERLALALYDVAGAGPQVMRLARLGGSVCVLGAGGKSGLLVSAAARERVGPDGVVVGVEQLPAAVEAATALGLSSAVVAGDATDPVATVEAALGVAPPAVRAAGGFDLVVSCVNASKAEMAAILLARDRGTVYFFGMATEFARAALGAEGVSRDVDLMIGNGYCVDHARETLALARRHPQLLAELGRRYA